MRAGKILVFPAFLLFVALSGCGQHGCMSTCPLPPRHDNVLYPPACPHDGPDGHDGHDADLTAFPTVSTVLNPEATKREITLQECIALALEKGRVGGTNIRVLAYDPAILYTAIDEGLSVFDARFTAGMSWSSIDERQGNVFSSLPLGLVPTVGPSATGTGVVTGAGPASTAGVINNGTFPFNVIQGAGFNSRLEKLLPTGGLAGITFLTDYTNVIQPPPQGGEPNPAYRTRLIFTIDQPLLRGAGVTINNVPIVIARLSFDQQREVFYNAVNQLLFGVEQAYWNLYFSYWNLHTIDLALRQAHDAWEVAKQMAEKKLVTVQDLAALELQYQSLRLARLDALGGQGLSVLEAERQLRFVVGLPPEDGSRLIPSDTPTTAPYVPDWPSSLTTALGTRPELVQLHQAVKKIQLEIKQAQNKTLPDLRFVGSYDINGLGTRLDGSTVVNGLQDNALRSLASNHFNNWTAGLTLDVPIGFRAANAQLRRAQLQLAQRIVLLKDMEKQAAFALQQSYRELVRAAEAVQIRSGIRKAATEKYQAFYEKFRAGLENPIFLLQAQTEWTKALADERATIFGYNVALAKFELERGTIQQYDNVSIADGPLPACVQARADAHIRARQLACVVRERPVPCGGCAPAALIPAVSAGPPSIPALQQQQPLTTDGPPAAELLPPPPGGGKAP
jgi:outer membrane protein TolC